MVFILTLVLPQDPDVCSVVCQSFVLVIVCLSVKWSRADEVSGESLQNITAFSLFLSLLLHSSFSRGILVFLVSVRFVDLASMMP
jgi:hypothetical protein